MDIHIRIALLKLAWIDMRDALYVPRLPQYASSLWRYGHLSYPLLYCDDWALVEALGDRYVPEGISDLHPLFREDLRSLIYRKRLY